MLGSIMISRQFFGKVNRPCRRWKPTYNDISQLWRLGDDPTTKSSVRPLEFRAMLMIATFSCECPMDDDYDLTHFSNIGRLFPLPGVVLFPHSVLPLHIFEPRYRQMTEDALASDRLVTIVQTRPPLEWKSPGTPTLERFGCLGRIFKHERLPDGRFNFLLLGRKRVELLREIPGDKLYRMSELRIVEDIPPGDHEGVRRDELISNFRSLHPGGIDRDLDSLFDSELPLGVLTDIIAQALGLGASVKQTFLAEPVVVRRAIGLLGLLRQMKENQQTPQDIPSKFPPPFSLN
ncbi:LON peptidase substrate-binding domain-containing protein [Tundrisphaera lichenicola]|uniref:LON peptidase substrate-binding domain-containing protein n=1 Tax=Tundrisphaera lichenicola TaxID=2029860 RepID=UPI003EB75AC8